MALESLGGETGMVRSPGGFEFGVQGWQYGPPIPSTITFFLDNTAMVCDQYGRSIRGAVTPDLRSIIFAACPPDGIKEGPIEGRPQYATHAQILEALTLEGVDWQAYEVRYTGKDSRARASKVKSLEEAGKIQARLIHDGNTHVHIVRAITCAGWPQLCYEQLKKMGELPPTPTSELRKIRDKQLRQDALRMRAEMEEMRRKEYPDDEEDEE